jgi:catechol 2,3-dioxygenase-like lactoylglutathione lyase family enzyme
MPESHLARTPKLSSRAKRGICFLLVLGVVACLPSQAQSQRPRIFGISSVQISVTDYCKGIDFYSDVLGRTRDNQKECPPPGQTTTHYGAALRFQTGQQLNLGSFDTPNPYKLVNEFGFETDDLPALLEYLKSQGVYAQTAGKTGLSVIIVQDPEGHRIAFSQRHENSQRANRPTPVDAPQRIIHIGFIVSNQTRMEHFYKEILGFHVYWHGGMKDKDTDWLDLQVPDGTDWIEFMLNVPADADKKLLGIMNHIALGVPDIQAAAKQLLTNGMKLTEEPKIGRDGKWQLNLYDPDDTRVELMEFTPVEKPCCSDYTGPHPKP